MNLRIEDYENKLKEAKKGTDAFLRFHKTSLKTRRLLWTSIEGLKKIKESHDEVLTKLHSADMNKVVVVPIGDGDAKLNITVQEIELLKEIIVEVQQDHSTLDKYYYSTLVVFIWGAFETYLNQAFSEVYRLQPSILKNMNINFSSADIIDNIDDPLEFLIKKELDKVGHFKINDWAKYLKSNINFEFEKSLLEKLSGIYLVRNIVAHNTGIVRPDQLVKIPNGLDVQNDELEVTEKYLNETIENIDEAVKNIESLLIAKFYKEK